MSGRVSAAKKWSGRFAAALLFGGCIGVADKVFVHYDPGIIGSIPLLAGWFAAVGYFMGTCHHDG